MGLKVDFQSWFESRECPDYIHTTTPMRLQEANQVWLEWSNEEYPQFRSLLGFVSYFSFGRFVECPECWIRLGANI